MIFRTQVTIEYPYVTSSNWGGSSEFFSDGDNKLVFVIEELRSDFEKAALDLIGQLEGYMENKINKSFLNT